MRSTLFVVVLLLTISSSVTAQGKPPVISARSYTGGSAKVTVTGTFSISADIPINVQASFGDGEMTWLQFGASGSAEPNALLTFNKASGETGIIIGKGKLSATGGVMDGEKTECTGKSDVTPTLVSGRYVCTGLTSYDPATGKMGKVNVEVVFTAKT